MVASSVETWTLLCSQTTAIKVVREGKLPSVRWIVLGSIEVELAMTEVVVRERNSMRSCETSERMNSRRRGSCSPQRSSEAGWTRSSKMGEAGVKRGVPEGKHETSSAERGGEHGEANMVDQDEEVRVRRQSIVVVVVCRWGREDGRGRCYFYDQREQSSGGWLV